MISIEDERDYHADFVLATLLDDSAPPPPRPPQTAPSSVANATAASSTAATSSQHQKSAAVEGDRDARLEEEGGGNGGDVGSRSEQGGGAMGSRPRLIGHKNKHPGEKKSLNRGTSDSSVTFPSGSQFRRGSSRKPGKVSRARHVPPPPVEMDFDRVTAPLASSTARSSSGTRDGHSSQHHAASRTHGTSASQHGSTARSSTPKASAAAPAQTDSSSRPCPGEGEDYDVMDALFGEDNMDVVAQDGQIFGFEHRRDVSGADGDAMEQGPSLSNKSRENGSQGDGTGEKESVVEGMEEGSPERSTLDESSFLPGTPPSKKVRSFPVANVVLYSVSCSSSLNQHQFCLGWTCLVVIFTTLKYWQQILTLTATKKLSMCMTQLMKYIKFM